MSDKEMVIELLSITEIEGNDKVVFTDRSIEIIKELGEKYEKTELFKRGRENNPNWEGDANAALIYVFLCEKIEEAQSFIHCTIAIKMLLPILWEKLNEEIKLGEQV